MNDFVLFHILNRLIFIKNLFTSYWQIVLLPQRYLLFFVKHEYGLKMLFWQGSFWGAILRDSRIFFSKIAFILLLWENSRNIDIEASGIELDSFRVDFVLFLRLNSV